YNETVTVQTRKPREALDLTSQVKAAMEKSVFRDGIILVSTLHSNAAVIVNDNEAGLLDDLDAWLNEIAPPRDDFKHTHATTNGRFESNAAVHFQSLLLSHQAIVPFSEKRLDLGPHQAVLFVELDGLRPKRILVKVIGE